MIETRDGFGKLVSVKYDMEMLSADGEIGGDTSQATLYYEGYDGERATLCMTMRDSDIRELFGSEFRVTVEPIARRE